MPTVEEAKHTSRSSVHMDAIRGAAALAVLFGHTRDLFFPSLNGKPQTTLKLSTTQTAISHPAVPRVPAPTPLTIGNEAVMVFFVLSGYLVGGSAIKSIQRNTWSWNDYLLKRLTRLWVVLIPALLLGVALDFAGLHFFPSHDAIYTGPAQQMVVPVDVPHLLALHVVAANAVFLQSIFVETAGTNGSLWSLANEFWYYIAFPLLLLGLRKDQKLLVRCAFLLLAAAIFLLVGKSISLLFFIWALGALVSVIPRVVPQSSSRLLGGIAAVLLPIVFVGIRRAGIPLYPAEWMVALYFSGTLYLILHQGQPSPSDIYKSIAGFFSRISYTLYLVHLPLAVLLCATINTPWHHWPKSPKNLLIYLTFNVVLICVAYLFYLAFEANTDSVRGAIVRGFSRQADRPVALHQPEEVVLLQGKTSHEGADGMAERSDVQVSSSAQNPGTRSL